MATGKTSIPIQHDESQMLAHTYQQAMQNLTAVVEANPLDGGVVTLQPKTLTKVNVQAGQHYKVRKLGNDGQTLETPDNVVPCATVMRCICATPTAARPALRISIRFVQEAVYAASIWQMTVQAESH